VRFYSGTASRELESLALAHTERISYGLMCAAIKITAVNMVTTSILKWL
jgi:hypothetical protein